MTLASLLQRLAAVDTPPVRRAFIIACVAITTLVGMYCAGEHRQATRDQVAQYSAEMQRTADTIRVLETRIVHDTVPVAATRRAAAAAVQKFAAADTAFRDHVDVLSETTVSVDGKPATDRDTRRARAARRRGVPRGHRGRQCVVSRGGRAAQ